MKYMKKTAAIIMSMMMLITMIPAASYAGDEIAAPEGFLTESTSSTEVPIGGNDQNVQTEEPAIDAGEEGTAAPEDEETGDSEKSVIDEAVYTEEAEDIPDDADFGEKEFSEFGLGHRR